MASALRSALISMEGSTTQVVTGSEASILERVPDPPAGYELHINTPGHAASVVPLTRSIVSFRSRPMSTTDSPPIIARRIHLNGRVQGLGVRPAIARLASELQLCGFTRNGLCGVEIHIEGHPRNIDAFESQLPSSLPRAWWFWPLPRC